MTDGTAAAPGAGAPLVDDVRAAAAAERLRIRLFEDGRERPDAETLAPGVELAAHRIERGQPGFHAVALGIAATLGADPVRLRVFLRGWYEGARGLLEDNGRPTDALDSPEAVRAALQALTGFDDRAPLAPSPAPRPAAAPAMPPAPRRRRF